MLKLFKVRKPAMPKKNSVTWIWRNLYQKQSVAASICQELIVVMLLCPLHTACAVGNCFLTIFTQDNPWNRRTCFQPQWRRAALWRWWVPLYLHWRWRHGRGSFRHLWKCPEQVRVDPPLWQSRVWEINVSHLKAVWGQMQLSWNGSFFRAIQRLVFSRTETMKL